VFTRVVVVVTVDEIVFTCEVVVATRDEVVVTRVVALVIIDVSSSYLRYSRSY